MFYQIMIANDLEWPSEVSSTTGNLSRHRDISKTMYFAH